MNSNQQVKNIVKNKQALACFLACLFLCMPKILFADEATNPTQLEKKQLEVQTKTDFIEKKHLFENQDQQEKQDFVQKKEFELKSSTLLKSPKKPKKSNKNQKFKKPDIYPNQQPAYNVDAKKQDPTSDLQDEEPEFDLNFLAKDVQNFSKQSLESVLNNTIPPGIYNVTLELNYKNLGSYDVDFQLKNKKLTPCLSKELLTILALKPEFAEQIANNLHKNSCNFLPQAILGSNFKFNANKSKLSLTIPNNILQAQTASSFDKRKFKQGDNSLFTTYRLSHYANINFLKDATNKISGSNLSLHIGANMSRLHLRTNIQLIENNFSETQVSVGSIAGYLDLPSIYSSLAFGLISTGGSKISNSNILGIALMSDSNMQPLEKSTYAPEVTGFANTNAVVIIKQKNREIYRTNVARGDFAITDLVNVDLTSSLTMEIHEADGSVSSKEISINYVAGVLRKGTYTYTSSFGFYNDGFYVDWKEPILAGEFNYGLHNDVSLLTGLSLTIRRQELANMLVYNSPFGTFNLNLNLVHSRMYAQSYFGARFGLSFSSLFETTDTNIDITAYTYTMKNYFDLASVIEAHNNQNNKSSLPIASVRNEFNVNITQGIPWNLGRFGFKLGYKDFWNNQDKALDFSLNYNVNISSLNLSFKYARVEFLNSKRASDTVSLGLSLPFSNAQASGSVANNIYFIMNKEKNLKEPTSFQNDTSISASFVALPNSSFSLGINNNNNQDASLTASSSWQFSKLNLSSSFSYNSNNYMQYGFEAQGALVVHEGGVNFVQDIGSSFAIIKAPDAAGAIINSNTNNIIAKNGYGILPNLSPYSLNRLALDINNLSSKLELDASLKEIICGNMATPIVEFKTNIENSVLVDLHLKSNPAKQKAKKTSKKQANPEVPEGAILFDQANKEIGFVGMGARVYIKRKNLDGVYNVVWGGKDNSCKFTLTTNEKDFLDDAMPIYNADCIKE